MSSTMSGCSPKAVLPGDGFVYNPVLTNNEAVTKINRLHYFCQRKLYSLNAEHEILNTERYMLFLFIMS